MSDLLARALAHAAAETTASGPDAGDAGGVPPGWVPAGPPSRARSGLTVVHLRQTHGGVPVRGAVRSVRFDARGRVTRFTGETVAVAPTVPLRPVLDARPAAYAAARYLGDVTLPELHPELAARVSNRRPVVLSRSHGPDAVTTLRKVPFQEPVTASLAVTGDGAALVWVVRFRLPEPGGAWTVLVRAESETPRVVAVERGSAHAVSGWVFRHEPLEPDADPAADPPSPLGRVDTPFPVDRSVYPPLGGAVVPRPAWVEEDELRGNNAWAEDDRGRTLKARARDGDLRFEPEDALGPDQAQLNAFFLCNVLHDFFYLLGFDEALGNFQEEVDARAGRGRDPVKVTVWDTPIPGLAFFVTHGDGFVSELHLGTRDGRSAALDPAVVIHEYVHGVTNRVVGGPDEAEPLRHPQSRALGEGFSDYFALSLWNRIRRRDGLEETTVYGRWISGNDDTGLRNHAYDDRFPGTYGMLGRDDFQRDHDAGQVWCAALLDVHRALGHGDGPDAADERAWEVVFDSLRLLHPGPRGPTFLHARDAVMATFDAAVEAGRLPDDPALAGAVRDAFARRGMGPAARSPSAGYHGIVEDLPSGDDS